ncbi:hypothetical protein EDC04DRAFT_777623 [Pisolithus marmoratus]|nr:hypothetical protein EDC04DRAFT_777623 [Pisolithus marmoratus]
MHAAFCLNLLGAPSLEILRQISLEEDQEKWSDLKQVLTDRTINVTVIAALVVMSSATFITVPSPTGISTWDPEFPYFCFLAAYGGGMLAIIVGFAQIVFLGIVGPLDIHEAQRSMFKFMALSMLLMLPLLLLLVAALCAGVGFVAALWHGCILWIPVFMTTSYAVFLVIMFMIIAVLY